MYGNDSGMNNDNTNSSDIRGTYNQDIDNNMTSNGSVGYPSETTTYNTYNTYNTYTETKSDPRPKEDNYDEDVSFGGFEDDRTGDLFFEMERIFKERKPRVIFLENVKNLVGHDKGNTFKTIIERLENAGYKDKIKCQVLNACEYGNIPQNRERIYIVAFRDKEDFDRFQMPLPTALDTSIKDVFNFDTKVDDKYYYTEGKYKGNIYKLLTEEMDDDNTVYQWRRRYVRKNQSNLVPTLTANMGEGGHNVPLIKTKFGIRKLTPIECFYAQGYPKYYELPTDMSDARLYKQAGNSVVVPVINRIAENIMKALN